MKASVCDAITSVYPGSHGCRLGMSTKQTAPEISSVRDVLVEDRATKRSIQTVGASIGLLGLNRLQVCCRRDGMGSLTPQLPHEPGRLIAWNIAPRPWQIHLVLSPPTTLPPLSLWTPPLAEAAAMSEDSFLDRARPPRLMLASAADRRWIPLSPMAIDGFAGGGMDLARSRSLKFQTLALARVVSLQDLCVGMLRS